MSVFECPDCHGTVSDRAATCPHCGRPNTPQGVAPLPRTLGIMAPETRPHDNSNAYRLLGALALIVGAAVVGMALSSDAPPAASQADGYYACQAAAQRLLKAPSTAQFPRLGDAEVRMTPSTKDSYEFHIVSYVDAQNAFGAMIRTRWICRISKTSGGAGWGTPDAALL